MSIKVLTSDEVKQASCSLCEITFSPAEKRHGVVRLWNDKEICPDCVRIIKEVEN